MGVAHLSDHVASAVEAEREVIVARLDELREQAARLHEIVARLEEEIDGNARTLRQIDEMLGHADQLSLEWAHGELRGQRLQEIAIRLLREKREAGAVVHYRDWYQLLVDAGARVGGKDPMASFLTQIGRSPQVESVRPRSGLYRLRSA